MADFDLILKGGRVIDPSQKLDGITDVAFAGGKVAAVGKSLKAGAGTEMRDVSGYIVSPGLIDLHTHVYWGGTSLGIDAEEFCRTSGVTTAIDTGSAGPGNFLGFRKHVIERSEVRILAYLHVSFAGIYAFSNTIMYGESQDMRLMAPRDAVEVYEKNRDVLVGIKVRVGLHASGDQGTAPLNVALQVADELGVPLMCHIDHPPPSYEAVLDMLRPGDVLTHAFRPFPNAPCTAQGKVKPAVLAARKTRRAVRHRPRQGLVLVQDRARDAGQRLLSRHHLVGRAHAVHQRTGLRPGDDHVEVPLPRHAAAEVIKESTVNAAHRLEAARAWHPEARLRRRRDDPFGQGGQVRLRRRARRASDRRQEDHRRRHRGRRQMVAPEARNEIPESRCEGSGKGEMTRLDEGRRESP